jgi:hypothetical protein
MRCLTCPSVPADQTASCSKAHLPTSAPLSRPGHQTRYPASYPEPDPGGAVISGPGFLSAFAHRHSLLGHPVPAKDFCFPHGRPTGPPRNGPDSVGVSVFRTHETRPGWVPSLPRGGGVLPISAASLIGACRFTTASPLPRCNLPPAELLITEHTKIHFRSPVRPFPRPSFPGGTGTLRLFPGLRTPRSPTTHARAGTVHRTLDRITSSSTDLQTA